MKIYINNFNLDILNDISELFKNKLVNAKNFIRLYTNEGIYCIEDRNVYRLEVVDKDIKKYEKYFNNFTLILDPSYFNKNIAFSIHGDIHESFNVKEYYYKMNHNSNISLVIKYNCKKTQFIPNDIYFEINREIDINDILIKKEIIEFLSLLN